MQVCKPGSVSRFLGILAIYLDLDSHQDSIDLPTPESNPEGKESNEQLFARGLFDLSTHKVCRAPFITVGAVGSYSTFSPLPRSERSGRFVFCGTVCPHPVTGMSPSR